MAEDTAAPLDPNIKGSVPSPDRKANEAEQIESEGSSPAARTLRLRTLATHVREAPDAVAPATTVKQLDLVSGTVSLLFQLFASCMTGMICNSTRKTKLT